MISINWVTSSNEALYLYSGTADPVPYLDVMVCKVRHNLESGVVVQPHGCFRIIEPFYVDESTRLPIAADVKASEKRLRPRAELIHQVVEKHDMADYFRYQVCLMNRRTLQQQRFPEIERIFG